MLRFDKAMYSFLNLSFLEDWLIVYEDKILYFRIHIDNIHFELCFY